MTPQPPPRRPGADIDADPAAGASLTPEFIAATAGGSVIRGTDRAIRGAAVDSRLVQPGELFIALPGERTDGHRFAGDAIRRGAAAVLIRASEAPALLSAGLVPADGDAAVIAVADPLTALQAVAHAWRRRFQPLTIGITGSIAKTSTKEAVAGVLGSDRRTLRSEGNQNNEIGLPLTLLRLGPEHAAAVLEMGMYVGGEIRDLAAMAEPSIGVVTAVQGVHLSRIGSIEAIEAAKGELVEALPPDGVAVLNADDPRVRRMAARTSARVVTYGFAPDADVRAEDVESVGFDGMRFRLRAAERAAIRIPTLGRLSVHNATAAAAVGLAAGMGLESIARALAGGWAAPHRVAIVRAGPITLIDDAYNASPASVIAALELLAGLPGRRLAVLGEMLELGAAAEAGHVDVGRAAAAIVDQLVVVGSGASGIARGARTAGLAGERIAEVADPEAATGLVRAIARPGDVALVKASRGVRLDRLVADLAADPPPASGGPSGVGR